MKRREGALSGSVLLVLTCCLTVRVASLWPDSWSGSDLLKRDTSRIPAGHDRLSDAVGRALIAARAPGGLAVVYGCEGERSYDLPALGPTLGDALAAIRKAAPDYEWRLNDNVVNLFPKGGFPDLLRTRANEFDSGDANNITWAGSLLMGLPEVREAISKLRFQEVPNQIELGMSSTPKYGTPPPPTEPPLDVRCRTCSVYQVLNALVQAKGRQGLWIYYERRCGGAKTFHITFSD